MEFSLRQKQILHLLSLGKSNKEIAYELNLSEGTIKQHLYTLYKKLGVTSRSKAIIVATKIISEFQAEEGAPQKPSSVLEKELPSTYIWRLISAVAVYPHPGILKTPGAVADFDGAMNQIHCQAKLLTDALDGHLTILPGVGFIACFGVPKAHLDDSARAMTFASQMREWSINKKMCPISMGISTAPEVVADLTNTIYRAESFEMAARYAVEAPPYRIIANEISCRLAGPLQKYSRPKHDVKEARAIREVLLAEKIDVHSLAKKSPLPFMAEMLLKNNTKEAHWVKVTGWPPHHIQRLQDTIAIHLESSGINTFRLRLPSCSSDIETMGKSIFEQINIQTQLQNRSGRNEVLNRSFHSNSAKIVSALKTLSIRGPIALVNYGINTHLNLIQILGTKAIEDLSKCPIIFVNAELNDDDISHVKVTILGSKPGIPGKYKSYQLPLPKPILNPNGIHSDLATLIDNLSPEAHKIIQLIVTQGSIKAMGISQFLGEVMATGLFSVIDGVLQCRDQTTVDALTSLYVQNKSEKINHPSNIF
jgi:DNA-binding CsgD family transcriptional regulator